MENAERLGWVSDARWAISKSCQTGAT
jgi:hypothetical protein